MQSTSSFSLKSTQLSPVNEFHDKVIKQITYHLNKSRSFNKNINQNVSTSNEFLQSQIRSFLYDILELQNSSINFIMQQIFRNTIHSSWALEQILKIILDIQFITVVNNFVIQKYQPKSQQDINFAQLSFQQIIVLIEDNCFFIRQQQKPTRKLISQMVNQINQHNGNKGHILIFEYKNFMFQNLIQKHNRKTFTPRKNKSIEKRDRYFQANSISIKQVDEQSQLHATKSNQNFTNSEAAGMIGQQIKLGQYSKINSKLNIEKEQKHGLQSFQQQKSQFLGPESKLNPIHLSTQSRRSQNLFEYFHETLWSTISKKITPALNIQQHQTRKSQLLKIIQLNTSSQRIYSKLSKTLSNHPFSKIYAAIIRSLGQETFKTLHDQRLRLSLKKLTLDKHELVKLLSQSYEPLIQKQNSSFFEDLVLQLIKKNSPQLSYKDYLLIIQHLASPPKNLDK